jgi:bacterioferritin (cytochrome b1)
MTSIPQSDGSFSDDTFSPELHLSDGDKVIRQLNSFLRGEISASETYRMAIDKLADEEFPAVSMCLDFLRQMQREHGLAAQALRDRIRELGGEAADSSGVWGTWAKLTQGTANLFGDKASLKLLKEGEEHGLKDYSEHCPQLDAVSAHLVCDDLLPAQQRHIDLLEQLIRSQNLAA